MTRFDSPCAELMIGRDNRQSCTNMKVLCVNGSLTEVCNHTKRNGWRLIYMTLWGLLMPTRRAGTCMDDVLSAECSFCRVVVAG